MDLNKYLEENLDRLIDEIGNNKEILDDELIDNYEELKNNYENNEELEELKTEKTNDLEYYVKLINIFMEFYNKKNGFNKNFYEGMNNEYEMNEQMSMFNSALYLLNYYKEINEYMYNFECMENIFVEIEDIKKNKMVENDIYMLEFENKKMYSNCLIIVLNYIIVNDIVGWNIKKIN
jgi:hypothetical protein